MSVQSFTNRLDNINETQDSINALSTYMILNEKLFDEFLNIWKLQILRTKDNNRKLLLLYLCNDVIQKAKRQNKLKYLDSFSLKLLEIINIIYYSVDSNIKKKITRLISVWEDRLVFDNNIINNLKQKLTQEPEPIKEIISPQPDLQQINGVTPELKHINDLFQHINQLTDISQGNLTQLGIQSKTYLNLKSDNLPKTQIHLNKLNILEKLSNVSIANIEKIKSTREDIKNSVESLLIIINEGIKTDNSKIEVIREKLNKTYEIRAALSGEFEKKPVPNNNHGIENEENNVQVEDEDDDDLPTYENEDSDSDDEPQIKRRKLSPSPSAKKVAFSEDIEINEFEHKNEEIVGEEEEDNDDDDEFVEEVGEAEQEEVLTEEPQANNVKEFNKEETPSVMDLLKKLV